MYRKNRALVSRSCRKTINTQESVANTRQCSSYPFARQIHKKEQFPKLWTSHQTDRQTDRQTDKHTDRETGTEKHTNGQTDGQIDGQTNNKAF